MLYIVVATLILECAIFSALYSWYRSLQNLYRSLEAYKNSTNELADEQAKFQTELMARAHLLDQELTKLQSYDLQLRAYRDNLSKELATKYFSVN